MLRRHMMAVVLFALSVLGSEASEHAEGWFSNRAFLACDESIYVACSGLSTAVRLKRDHTVETEHDELKGDWRLLGENRISIGQREFAFLPHENFLSPHSTRRWSSESRWLKTARPDGAH